MYRIHPRLCLPTLVAFLVLAGPPELSGTPGTPADRAGPDFELRDGDRVVLIGNALIEHAGRYGYIETALTTRWPDRRITFRNLGWSGDTVSGEARIGFGPEENTSGGWVPPRVKGPQDYGFAKLLQQVRDAKPSVIIVGYGARVAFGGDAGLSAFGEGLNRLLDELEKTTSRIVLFSPVPQEDFGSPMPDPTEPNKWRKRNSELLRGLAENRGHSFVDLFTPFEQLAPGPRRTVNSIHLNADGYRLAAGIVEQTLGAPRSPWRVELTVTATGSIVEVSGTRITGLRAAPGRLQFQSIDETLPSPTGLVPHGDQRILQVKGLAAGRYRLRIDGKPCGSGSASEWAEGVPLAHAPEPEQAERLRETINEKNRLFFYRYRPHNKTYVLLFRRYEMGHLARELERFDPLIEEKEEAIARLCKPVAHHYELLREELPSKNKYMPDLIPEANPTVELKSFKVAEGFEINLFASDPMIANPTQINWDGLGRLWVSTSSIYPHIAPGQKANDRITVLEDTDRDGQADRFTVFADGLLVPHAVEPGDGGAYVTSSTELLHLADTDGDGRADARRVLLSGFGNADTHHLIHTLRRGPAGMLYFNQSIYINSYIETAWGPRHLRAGGVWQYRPDSGRLEVHTRGLTNPWGHAFDRWGQEFATDAVSSGGINFAFRGAAFIFDFMSRRIVHSLNQGKPKYCGLEVLSGRHLPESWRGSLLTNDFRGNRIVRYELTEDGSAFAARQVDDVAWSSHVSFRPVDVKMGPDGAIYIADWYNPTVGHGEVDFRDPRRDHTHGRIWRLTAKNRPLVEPPRIVGAPVAELLDALKQPEDWTRKQARQQLQELGANAVAPALRAWVRQLEPASSAFEHHRIEALWVFQSLGVVEPRLLRAVLRSKNHRARAAAVRVLSYWHENVGDGVELLATAVTDDHGRVRLEAVSALYYVDTPRAVEIAMRALEKPVDPFIDYALWRIANQKADLWFPEFKAGRMAFSGNTRHLVFALKTLRNPAALAPLVKMLRAGEIAAEKRSEVLELFADIGGPTELALLFDLALDDVSTAPVLLDGLQKAAGERGVQPKGDLSRIHALLDSNDTAVQSAAARLAGIWKVEGARQKIASLVDTAPQAAVDGLAFLGGEASAETLVWWSTEDQPVELRSRAVIGLTGLNLSAAADHAARLLAAAGELEDHGVDPARLFDAFLRTPGGPEALARSLQEETVSTAVATMGVRKAVSTGRELDGLVKALLQAGSIAPLNEAMTPAEIEELAADVKAHGNANRGERVYRQSSLKCMTCHAIAGAGGSNAPDLISIGASASTSHLIESLVNPSAKIKEGFHPVIVQTKDGNILTGLLVHDDKDELVIRDQEDATQTIRKENVESRSTSSVSMMPVGLTRSLRRDQILDLVRFLSELGKEGPWKVPVAQFVRRWRALENAGELAQDLLTDTGDPGKIEDPDLTWRPQYSTVAGDLPLDDLPLISSGATLSVLRFDIDVTTPGAVTLSFNETRGLSVRVGKVEPIVDTLTSVNLPRGRHTVTVILDREERRLPLRIELLPVKWSGAQAQLVVGS